MFITNFVYEKEGAKREKSCVYSSAFPQNWCSLGMMPKSLRRGKYMMMHSLIYTNMNLLHKSGLRFARAYVLVDICLLRLPLQYKSLYILCETWTSICWITLTVVKNQSVNEEVMISRIDPTDSSNELLMAKRYHSDWQFLTVLKNYPINPTRELQRWDFLCVTQ